MAIQVNRRWGIRRAESATDIVLRCFRLALCIIAVLTAFMWPAPVLIAAEKRDQPSAAGVSATAGSESDSEGASLLVPAGQTQQKTSAGEAKPAVAAKKPEPAKDIWPKWFRMGVQYRGRFENPKGRSYAADIGDGYYLHRFRLDATLKAGKHVDFYAMTQDSRVMLYDVKVRPSGFMDVFDLRQAYMDLHGKSGKLSLAFRVGRQYLDMGSRRLVAVSAWGNSPPPYDAAKLSFANPAMTADVFAATRLSNIKEYEFSENRKGENLYGTYMSFGKLVKDAKLEPFFYWRTQPSVKDEKGGKGDSDLYTAGARFLGKLPHRFDYTLEMAIQRGTYAADDVSSWAGSWGLGYLLNNSALKPKVLFEYNYATGDKVVGDGKRGTFDQLYPSNHPLYGIADVVGWRNTSNYKVGLDVQATKRLRLQFDVNNFYLATTQDALYTDGGSAAVTNRKATSRHVGWEPDLQATFKVSKMVNVGAGYGALIPGKFLKESTAGHTYHYPYLHWEFQY
jgi:hypothetical protein